MQDTSPGLPVSQREQGSKGWRSSESARLPPMWPGFKSRRRRHMWVEFVVGFLLCSERFFSGPVWKTRFNLYAVNFPKCATEGSFPSALLIPAGYIAHAQYNVQLSVTSPFLPSWTLIGSLSNGDSDVKCWQISLELNSKGLYQISGKEKENCCFVFPSLTKREIRHFHVVVGQWGQRNIQKSVMHVHVMQVDILLI